MRNLPRFFVPVCAAVVLATCGGERADEDPPGSRNAPVVDSPAATPPTAGLPVLEGVARFAPVDEGPSDPGFARFRAELLSAIARRDTSALLAVVAPDIRNTFGGDDGIASFRELWRLGEPDSELWSTLETVLRHGGVFRTDGADTSFVAPYVFAAWPGEHDAFEHVATLTDDAVLRAAPDSAAAPLGVVPHAIVRHRWQDADAAPEGWTAIELPRGLQGWIATADVHSPVGYRAIFARRERSWRMVTLIAGD